MTFVLHHDGMAARNTNPVGPAGTVTARISPRLVAEVDMGNGEIISLTDTSPIATQARLDLIFEITKSKEALDAVRRLTLATVFADEEPASSHLWWQLDRTLALLDLDDAVALTDLSEVSRLQTEIDVAIETLRNPTFVVTATKAPLVQALIDLVLRKRPGVPDLKGTVDVLQQEMDRDLVELGNRGQPDQPQPPIGVPTLVLLSSGPDLAHARTGLPFSIFFQHEIDMTLVIPLMEPATLTGRFNCFLVEPGHESPVVQIAGLTIDDKHPDALVARFRVSHVTDLSGYELVVLPNFDDPTILTHTRARAIRQAEILLRTAIRLAQKGHRLEALGRLDDGESCLRKQDVPEHFTTRLRDIRRRIEDDAYSRDSLGDL